MITSRFSLSLAVGAVAALSVLGSCRERETPIVKRDPQRPRRVIEPPSRGVHALPPHAIRADGVGPYKLGALAADLLDQLPSGPRIRQFTIPGIVHRDMLRGEDDAILIGTEPQGRAMFVAVVRGEIARTEAGIQVGSTRDELEHALGAPVEDLERTRDPRIVVPTKLDNAHIVIDGNRISAIVLTPPGDRTKETAPVDPSKDKACVRPPDVPDQHQFGACLTSAGEVLHYTTDEIDLLGKEEKVAASVHVPGLVFAAALRNPADGRDDIVAITETSSDQQRTWALIAYRLLDGKLLRVIEPTTLYQLTAANARWVGAELSELDLLLELSAKADSIDAGGLLATRIGGNIRDIVVISPASVPRRRGAKVTPPEPSGSGSGSGSGAASAAPSQGSGHAERPAR